MSGKPSKPNGSGGNKGKKIDRRVRRTRDSLGDALVALMHELPFQEITVQHVLDRAGVSRSTFYTHFSDKDDLFLSDVEDFLDLMAFALSRRADKSQRVAPVQEFFAHVAEWKEFHAVLVKANKIGDFLELGQGYFARGIEQRLKEIPRAQHLSAAERAASAQMFAGSMMSLVTWWLSAKNPASPAEMDEQFHRMVWQGVRQEPHRESVRKAQSDGKRAKALVDFSSHAPLVRR